MNYDLVDKRRKYFSNIKLLILEVFQLIFMILFIVFAIFAAKTFQEYGSLVDIVKVEQYYPNVVEIERIRLYFLLFTILYLTSWFLSGCMLVKYKNNYFKYAYLLSLFSWVLLPFSISNIKKNKDINNLKELLNQDDGFNSYIDHSLLKTFFKKESWTNKKFINTLLSYITLIMFIVGMGLLFVFKKYDSGDPYNIVLLSKFSYFTNLTNIACFIYMFLIMFLFNKQTFKNNTYLVNLMSYITIVGLIYWVYLFPTKMMSYHPLEGLSLVRNIWLHGINQVFFISFALLSFNVGNNNLIKFRNSVQYGCIYPISYGIYIYLIPFFVRTTIYGMLTNTNSYMVMYEESESSGNYFYFFFIVAIALVFIMFMILFSYICNILVKKNMKSNME